MLTDSLMTDLKIWVWLVPLWITIIEKGHRLSGVFFRGSLLAVQKYSVDLKEQKENRSQED